MSKSLHEYQIEHKIWSEKNFPNETYQDILQGITEENGELNHHLLKQKQHIRGTWAFHEAKAKDSVGDIVVYLTHLCTLRGWNLEQIINDTFDDVLTRDWTEDKLSGKTATAPIQGQE